MGPFFKLDNPLDSLRTENVTTDAITGVGWITNDCALSDPGDDCFDMPGLRVVGIYFKNHICFALRLLSRPSFSLFCVVTRHDLLKQSSFFIKMIYNMRIFVSFLRVSGAWPFSL